VWTCGFTHGTAPTLNHHWIGLTLEWPEVSGNAYQFGSGDFNQDGIDTIAVRRGVYVVWSNAALSNVLAVWNNGQHFGAPRPGLEGQLVVGDWDSSLVDTFGLYYPSDGWFYRRDDLSWNSGIYFLQRLGLPAGSGTVADTWRAYVGSQFSAPLPTATNTTVPTAELSATPTATLDMTLTSTPTETGTPIVTPTDTPTTTATETSQPPTVEITPTDTPTAT